MLDPFILKALVAGIGIALMTGPLGCFIAWQRMAYFGDMMAHSALLGVVLALAFELPVLMGVVAVAVAMALLLHRSTRQRQLAGDSLLGIAAHGALALGLVLLSLSSITVDVNGLLFGDVLAVSEQEIILIYGLAVFMSLWLFSQWRALLRMTIHSDIAKVEGVNIEWQRLGLMLALALTVALSIKVVGILLVTSMLIIPAAAARAFSKTPTQMALIAVMLGMVAVGGGLYASLAFDLPTGPSIILAALGCFIVSRLRNCFT